MKNPDTSNVRHLMEQYGEICVITREENLKLNNAGLNRNMPQVWQIGTSDVFAHYHAVGIQIWTNNIQW